MKTMMKKTNTLAISLLMALSITACVPEKKETEEKSKVTVDAQMNAEQLTEAAEQLVGPYTFMIASKVAEKALEKDPNNIKAQFIVKLLKRFEAFRGIHPRLRSYLNVDQLAKHDKWLREFPDSPMKKFLSAPGGKPIKTVTDIQNVLGDYYAGIVEFREFLKKNQNKEFDIQLNANVFEQEIKQQMYDSCQTYVTKDGHETTVECNYADVAKKKINSADMIALRQAISGEIIHGLLFTGYTLEGAEKLEGKNLTNQQKADLLSKTPTFGLLRKNHNFNLLRDIGSDLSASLKWAIKYQSNLCPEGEMGVNQRRGYLFADGICVNGQDQELQNFMATLDKALGGVTQIEMEKADGTVAPMNVNLFAWSSKPVQDLRQISPATWNECDKATSLKDNSFGGIFVDQNVNTLLDTSCE